MRKLFSLTALELLVTITIFFILIGLAVPAYRSVIQNNKSSSLANEFLTFANLARSEATKRRLSVSMCAANTDQTACSNNWQNGWIVFTDQNSNGEYNSNDEIIKIHGSLDLNITPAAGTNITFSADGFLINGAGSYYITPPNCSYDRGARVVEIYSTGRAEVNIVSCL